MKLIEKQNHDGFTLESGSIFQQLAEMNSPLNSDTGSSSPLRQTFFYIASNDSDDGKNLPQVFPLINELRCGNEPEAMQA